MKGRILAVAGLLFLWLTLAGCGGGGGGNPSPVSSATPTPTPTPPADAKSVVTSLVAPGIFSGPPDAPTISLSGSPGVTAPHATVGVTNIRATHTGPPGQGMHVFVGPKECQIVSIGPDAGIVEIVIPLGGPSGLGPGAYGVRVVQIGVEAEQSIPPVTLTVTP